MKNKENLTVGDVQNILTENIKEAKATPSIKSVSKGTPLTDNTINLLLKKNNNNVDAALKEAKSLGFDIGD